VDSPWSLYQRQPSFLLGFHGTDSKVVESVVGGKSRQLESSKGSYEWLGHGVYFWENDPERALDWAHNGKTKGDVKKPAVIGAVIDLGFCLDLTTLTGLAEVEKAFRTLSESYGQAGVKLPENIGGPDNAKRELDCQVIQALHVYRREHKLPEYDSVRAPFPEAEHLYDNSGFRARNHIQICVIKPERCIKGYFKPMKN
jgi:hypothetical protein